MFHAVLQVTWFPWFPWVAAKATWGAEASFSAVAGQLTFRKTQELLRSQEFCSDSTRTRKGGPSGGHRKDQPQSDMGSEKFLTVLHFGGTQNNDGSRVDMICNCPGSRFNVLKSGEVYGQSENWIWGKIVSWCTYPPSLRPMECFDFSKFLVSCSA